MKAMSAEPKMITHRGKPVSVILPIKKYRELLERLEDADDVCALKTAKQMKLVFRPFSEYLAGKRRNRV